MRKNIILTLGLAALVYGAAAIAIPPGPDEIGEFYFYFNQSGQTVGQASMDCNGVIHQSGTRTSRYSKGYAFCPGD